jgi:hypothetical protein
MVSAWSLKISGTFIGYWSVKNGVAFVRFLEGTHLCHLLPRRHPANDQKLQLPGTLVLLHRVQVFVAQHDLRLGERLLWEKA